MLILNTDDLLTALAPIFKGEVAVAAFDTETTEVLDDRFTPWGTTTRIAGFSISFGETDLYAAVRHEPYDWRRQMRLVPAEWRDRLLNEEGVTPVNSWAPGWNPNLPLDETLQILRELFAAPGVQWRAHNWPFDAKMLLADGVALPEDMFDTQIYSVLTDERPLDEWDEENNRFTHQGHGLKLLGELYLGREATEKNLLDEAREALECNSWAHLPLRTIVAPYACQDTRLCIELGNQMLARPLASDPNIQALIQQHHAEMRHVIAMEGRGIKIDVAEAQRRAATREVMLPEIASRFPDFPLTSPVAAAAQLYGPLGYPKYRDKTDTEQATLKQVRALVKDLEKLPLIDTILEYRKVQKELTAFYRPLVEYADDAGTIYTTLNALRAATTRFSASKPNIQQMQKPKKGRELESVRGVFKPRDGHVFITPDYSQQELRVAGHFALAVPSDFRYTFTWQCTLDNPTRLECKGGPWGSGNPNSPSFDKSQHRPGTTHIGNRPATSSAPSRMNLVEGFLSGDRAFDPHQIMADAAGVDRDTGKTADFALIYGAGIAKIAETLDIPFAKAKAIFLAFWNQAFPELGHVRNFIGERLRQVGPESMWSHQKSIRTLHGGRIFLASSYKGFNYVVQRSCREILLKAIIGVADVIQGTPYRMLFPVHDELVIEAPRDSLDQAVVRSIAKAMVDAGAASKIPMVVEPSVCYDSWAVKEALPLEWGCNGVLEAKHG